MQIPLNWYAFFKNCLSFSKLLSFCHLDVEKLKEGEISEQTPKRSSCHNRKSISRQNCASAGLEAVQLAERLVRCVSPGHSCYDVNWRYPVACWGSGCSLAPCTSFLPRQTGGWNRPKYLQPSFISTAISNLLSLIDPASKTGVDGSEASQWSPISLFPLLPCIWNLGCPAPSPNWTALNSEFQYLPGNVQCLANTTRSNRCNNAGRCLILWVGSSFGRSCSSIDFSRWQKVKLQYPAMAGLNSTCSSSWLLLINDAKKRKKKEVRFEWSKSSGKDVFFF